MLQYIKFYLVIVVSVLDFWLGINGQVLCESPQYLEIGKTGSIMCSFDEDFYGVLWYDESDAGTNYPFFEFQNFVKQGPGYTSGEFDIYPNGSLIITYVSLEHEHVFRVAYIHHKGDRPVFNDIELRLIVKPLVPYPVFDQCGYNASICFTSALKSSLTCSVNLARPAVSLELMTRTIIGDRNISGMTTVTREGVGYTSRIVTEDITKFLPDLVFLVCKASALPGVLRNSESFLLAQKGNVIAPSKDADIKYIERDTRMELSCADTEIGFVVWKEAGNEENVKSRILFYSANIGKEISEIFVNDVTFGERASLVIASTKVKHSGIYICMYGNGLESSSSVYEVVVTVNPVPAYPIIAGCTNEQYCVLETDGKGTLTCTVQGIRPSVNLKWKIFSSEDENTITFSNDEVTVTEKGDTFDVTLTSAYLWRDESRHKVTIECRVPSSNELSFHFTRTIDVLLVKKNSDPTDGQGLPSTPIRLYWILPLVAVSVFLCALSLIIFIIHRRKIRNFEMKSAKKDEITSLLPVKIYDEKTISDLRDQFLKQLKTKYKDLYDAVQPIPYIKDRLYCVDKVFVESGIEFLVSVEGISGRGAWKTLKSYGDIFSVSQVSSPRRILEGEPGYGKSTVTLQLAYDWCNLKQSSFLKDVEILILLRLRQLGGVSSIYKAIKRFILPRDTTISETDIEQILRDSKSVIIILDGLDEYPDQDSIPMTDVMAIIARQMFLDFAVITTTRLSFLPKKYPPITKRIRLTGFDDKARRYYIRKAVVGYDDERVRKIEGHLEENPILSDLCQVPLLFVLFAHMTYEREEFHKLTSVTSFFRYMISCFHSHMRNKMDDENVRKYALFETEHGNFNKLAFEAFSGKNQRIVWDKDEMCQLVGQEFYEQYVRIGILVEEESIDIIDDPGIRTTEHVQYKTETRFYHKLFCEWYAAHYLAEFLQSNPAVNLSEFLRNLDPFDVQYLYRFTCGINSESGEKLIEYLKSIEGGDKFAILCILEQTGKIDNIKKTLCKLCDEGIVISGHDTLLLQRSSLQLLEVAAKSEIRIKYVNLNDCFSSVEQSGVSIKTTSSLILTSQLPIEKLAVTSYNRNLTDSETEGIFKFATLCTSPCHLRFGGSVPPWVIEEKSILSGLHEKGTKVSWRLKKGEPWYQLDLQNGRWKNEFSGKYANKDKFQHLESKFSREMLERSEDFHKTEMKEMRERLRIDALKRKTNSNDDSTKDEDIISLDGI